MLSRRARPPHRSRSFLPFALICASGRANPLPEPAKTTYAIPSAAPPESGLSAVSSAARERDRALADPSLRADVGEDRKRELPGAPVQDRAEVSEARVPVCSAGPGRTKNGIALAST